MDKRLQLEYAEIIGLSYFSPICPDLFTNEEVPEAVVKYVHNALLPGPNQVDFDTFKLIYLRSLNAKKIDKKWEPRIRLGVLILGKLETKVKAVLR